MRKWKIEYDPDCPPGISYGINKTYLQQKGVLLMKPAQVRSTLKVFTMFQNGEIAVYQKFREQIAKQGESYKGALLRLMKGDLK